MIWRRVGTLQQSFQEIFAEIRWKKGPPKTLLPRLSAVKQAIFDLGRRGEDGEWG